MSISEKTRQDKEIDFSEILEEEKGYQSRINDVLRTYMQAKKISA